MLEAQGHEFNSHGFYKYIDEHKLMASRCKTSGELYMPPRPICSISHSTDMEWVEMSGKGTISAFTVITVGPTRMVAAGYDRKNPYCTGIVKLAEGGSISAQIFGLDLSKPERIKVGTPVHAIYFEREEDGKKRTYLGFEVD